jgi:hypothetical protein
VLNDASNMMLLGLILLKLTHPRYEQGTPWFYYLEATTLIFGGGGGQSPLLPCIRLSTAESDKDVLKELGVERRIKHYVSCLYLYVPMHATPFPLLVYVEKRRA